MEGRSCRGHESEPASKTVVLSLRVVTPSWGLNNPFTGAAEDHPGNTDTLRFVTVAKTGVKYQGSNFMVGGSAQHEELQGRVTLLGRLKTTALKEDRKVESPTPLQLNLLSAASVQKT